MPPTFVRVSVIGATPTTHVTISEAAYRPAKHRLLKSPPLDRNGDPRPPKYGPPASGGTNDPAPAEAEPTTTGQEANE